MAQLTWRADKDLAVRDEWLGVGQYPTPHDMVEQFTGALNAFILGGPAATVLRKRSILIADIFAGDGRLGSSVRKSIAEQTKSSIHVSFVECDPSQATRVNGKRYPGSLVVANALAIEPSRALDIVVANPPYLALNVKLASGLELPWKYVAESGRNLYGVCIRRALEVCKPGGVVGVIAPFGWIRGHYARQLRSYIGQHCIQVAIRAQRDRSLFEDAQQDIAFQFFIKRRQNQRERCGVTFAYESGEPVVTHLPYRRRKHTRRGARYRMNVGPLVWNRHKRDLRMRVTRETVPVVYGGNVGMNGVLCDVVRKYRKRQHVRKEAVPRAWITRGPALLIRRTLRGKPGSWKIDSAILKNGYQFVAENHVLVFKQKGKGEALKSLKKRVIRALRRHVRFLGTPNLSVHKARDILKRALHRKD